MLNVIDGDPKCVSCHGHCEQSVCEVKMSDGGSNKIVDFGEIPISSKKEKFVQLKNKGRYPAVF